METPKKAGRPRQRKTSWQPEGVRVDKWGYFYRNLTTKEYVRWKHLKPDATPAQVWAAYEDLNKAEIFNTNALIKRYLNSPQFCNLGAQTQKDYRQYSKRIIKVFGNMDPDTISSAHVRLFIDKYSEHPSATNHARGFLSIIMNWGKERDYVTIPNPCDAVKPLAIKRKKRDYSDKDHAAFYNYLGENNFVMHQVALEIAYLCGARQQDVLRIYDTPPLRPTENDCYISKDGIVIWQAKTGAVQLKRFTPRLRAAVGLARSWKRSENHLKKCGSTPWLICTSGGSRYTRDGFNSSWIRMQREAAEKNIITARFRFHDTKHKGITDHDGDKQQFSGHATAQMVKRYDHSVQATDTIRKPMIGEDENN